MITLPDDPAFKAAEARVLADLSDHARKADAPFLGLALALEEWDGATWQGGLVGRMMTDWLYVQLLSVASAAQRRGIGQRLLVQAEHVALTHGMTGVALDTLSFQAPDYYPRLGYDVIGRLDNHPLGGARTYFAKRFATDQTRLTPDDPRLSQVLDLIHAGFADMAGRVEPPSSATHLTLDSLTRTARGSEVWVIGDPVAACMILTPRDGALYLGKLSVAADRRRQGLARRLVDLACHRAAIHGLPAVELQTRIELTDNHAIFAALGFAEVLRTAHPGYHHPTSITYRRAAAHPVTERVAK